jgi:hypothetical protein
VRREPSRPCPDRVILRRAGEALERLSACGPSGDRGVEAHGRRAPGDRHPRFGSREALKRPRTPREYRARPAANHRGRTTDSKEVLDPEGEGLVASGVGERRGSAWRVLARVGHSSLIETFVATCFSTPRGLRASRDATASAEGKALKGTTP